MTEEQPRRRASLLYVPLGTGFFTVLAVAGLLVAGLLAFDALSYAYRRIGISAGWMALILAGALLGSLLNIPVVRLRFEEREVSSLVTVFWVTYRVPVTVRTGRTTIAVNVGGAVVPSAVAVYLVCHDRLRLDALIAALIVTIVLFAVARPVPGVGIMAPALVPPACAAVAAAGLGGHAVAAVACVAGTLGTLARADVLTCRGSAPWAPRWHRSGARVPSTGCSSPGWPPSCWHRCEAQRRSRPVACVAACRTGDLRPYLPTGPPVFPE